MEDYGKHYAALNLQFGATQEEIRSAYRRMAKMYHPDKDASLYAEMRYYEARRAYDALRDRVDAHPSTSPNSTAGPRHTPRGDNFTGARTETEKRRTTSGAGWHAYESDFDFSSLLRTNIATDVNFNEAVWEYRKEEIKKRIPFSLEKIPVILSESINEAACIGTSIRVLLHVAAMKFLFLSLEYTPRGRGFQFVGFLFGSRLISNMFIFCQLICFALYRYYFPRYPASCATEDYKSYSRSRLLRNLAMSFLYGAGASFFIHMFNPRLGFSLGGWFELAIYVFFVLLPLWVG